MLFTIITPFSDDRVNLSGQEVPASCLFEDHHGNRWVLMGDSISPSRWAESRELGAIGVVRTAPLRYVEHTVFSERADRRVDQISINDRWFIPCDELPRIPETSRPVSGYAPFVHLHAHSEMSPLDAVATVDEMVDRAVALDQFAIAVTDHGYCAAHPQLQKAALASGVKPIFGVEANLVRNRHLREDRYDYWHFLLLARNEIGLRNLWAASSEAHIEGFYGRPRMDFETLARFSEGLIGSTACLRGPLKDLVMAGDDQGAKEMISRLRAIFPESLYLEIHTNAMPEQIALNQALVQLGQEMSLPLLAVCDAHYAEDCDHHLHKAWISAQTDKDLTSDQDLFSGNEHYYLKSDVEVSTALAYLGPDAVRESMVNTVEIARSCDVTIKQGSAKPVYHRYVAPGFESESSGADRDIEVLREKVETGYVTKRLGERDAEMIVLRDQLRFANRMEEANKIETYRERLERELEVMISKGFAGYFLVVEDYCDAARSGRTSAKKKILMGPGRGSVVGSLVAFLLGITQVDPIEADLLFERFITAGRNSPPDIDLDFPSSEREAITDYLTDRWGADRTVRVGTHGRLQNKSVFRSLEKVFRNTPEHAMEWTDLVEITKIIDAAEAHTAGLGLKWEELWEQEGDLLEPYRAKYPLIFEYAERMVKRLKSYGRHPSGVVIDPENSIVDRLPLRTAGDKDNRQVVTEFDMNTLELLGYLKFDILTLRTLDTIQVCLDMIRDDKVFGGKVDVDIDRWVEEYNDPQVWDMLCEGDTLGVFQIETSSGTRMVKRMQPRSIADLSAIITLVRPGPMRSGLTDTYIKRRFGQEPVIAIHPSLEPVLGRTYQSMIYQEDIMSVCSTLAGYDLEQADKVRAILGKKKVEEAAREGVKFVDRAVERGVERALAEAVWAQMQEFAKYCVTGDTRIRLAGAGQSSDGWLTVEQAYRRLHTPLRDPVVGRTKSGEEFAGPCDVCGSSTTSSSWTRGRCTACNEWRKKFHDPNRGVFGLGVHTDGRIRPCRILDVVESGEQGVWTITLANGMMITSTSDHRHLDANGKLRSLDDGLAIGDSLTVMGSYEPGRMENEQVGPGGYTKLMRWTAGAPSYCEECGHDGSVHRLERAHLDGDRTNNESENLRMLCVSCHKRHDYRANGRRRRGQKGYPSEQSQIVSIHYVGVRPTFDVVMDDPHVWIANGIATTNTFNRAHAWSYAVLAYWCAWLKCHFPAHFAVAVLSTIDKKRIPEFVEMTRRNGYEVLPPDVNESTHGFAVSESRLGIRYGFGSIASIGSATSDAIIQGQPYSSWDDFIERKGAKCNFGHVKTLASVGTFDRLIPEGKTRPALEAVIERLAAGKATTCRWKVEGFDGPNSLPCTFDWTTEVTIGKSGKPLKAKPLPKACTKACRQYDELEGGIPWPDLPGMTKRQIREKEREVLGVFLSSTPFDAFSPDQMEGVKYGAEIEELPPGNHFVYALINSVRLFIDKAGQTMAFMKINSMGYEADVTVFSKTLAKYKPYLVADKLCFLSIDANDRGLTLNAPYPITQEGE
jgi:DNA-directed DNA polymerase III PolC